jgi:hypothetical protein
MLAIPELTCPRCRGRMVYAEDVDGPAQTCFACGFARLVYPGASPEMPAQRESRTATLLERRPTHGKGKRRFRL